MCVWLNHFALLAVINNIVNQLYFIKKTKRLKRSKYHVMYILPQEDLF